MPAEVKHLTILLMLLLLACPISGQLSVRVDDGSDAKIGDEFLKAAYDFIMQGVDRTYETASYDELTSQFKKMEASFDTTNGDCRTLYSDKYVVKIRACDRRVVSLVCPLANPRQLDLFDESGRQIPESDLRATAVKIPLEDAAKAAKKYVRIHLGEHALEGLDLATSGLKRTGSFFLYQFTWREKPDANGIAKGMKMIDVYVNPESGVISEFSMRESGKDAIAKVTADDAKQKVLEAYKTLQDVVVTRRTLVTLRDKDRQAIPAWAVSFEYQSPEGKSRSGCYVHAETGEIIRR